MPVIVHDRHGEEAEALTTSDIETLAARILWRMGLTVGGALLAAVVAGTTMVNDLRSQDRHLATRIERVDTEGSQPVRALQQTIAGLQVELTQTTRLLQEVRDDLRAGRP